MKRFPFPIFVVVFLAFTICVQAAEKTTAKLTVLNSMERINQDQEPFGETQVQIKAARNEVESFQVIVSATNENIKVIKAEVSDLSGKDGIISKNNITLFREEYVRVRKSSSRAELPPGLYPDPLVPFINPLTGQPIEPRGQFREKWGDPTITKGFEMYAVPFDVWKGQNQPIWVDVSIPQNTPAGVYTGKLTVTLKNNTTAFVPVTVTVWDFALPDGPTHRNHFGSVQNVGRIFGVDQKSDKYRDIAMRYCQLMADHRINPPLPRDLLPETNSDGSLKITPERHQALKKFIEEFHVTDFEIPRAPVKDATTTNRDKSARYYKDYHQYLKENGWDKRSYIYMHDEPNIKENYEEVLAHGELVHQASPEMRCLVVEQTYQQDPSWPDIDPAVDIWCPLFAFIDRDSINAKLAHGDEVWSYTALSQRAPRYHPHYEEVKNCDPPYWHIEQPLTAYRVPTWINWQYKITGLLYWSTVTTVIDPWHNPAFSHFGVHWNGEGYMIYPGAPSGIDGPISCMRLKNIRDGMVDYEYFVLLEKLAGREAVTKIVSTVAPEWWTAVKDPKIFNATRDLIAKEILKLKK
ncbi:MAG: DUF6067 family protein [Kiritimatiellae bacterium]|nr:DUF6067 family protein [Kiritimatiellia bacterium]